MLFLLSSLAPIDGPNIPALVCDAKQYSFLPWLKSKTKEESLNCKFEEFGPLWKSKYGVLNIPPGSRRLQWYKQY
jgi:hypothetical protein